MVFYKEHMSMNDRITITGTSSEAIEQHVHDRLTAALDQHADYVRDVMVHLDDVNGPRKGLKDKRCQVIVQFANKLPAIVIDERDDDLYTAVSLAADRVKQSAGRHLGRARERRKAS
jgi:putative sigma-54 modulation protein